MVQLPLRSTTRAFARGLFRSGQDAESYQWAVLRQYMQQGIA